MYKIELSPTRYSITQVEKNLVNIDKNNEIPPLELPPPLIKNYFSKEEKIFNLMNYKPGNLNKSFFIDVKNKMVNIDKNNEIPPLKLPPPIIQNYCSKKEKGFIQKV